MALRELAAGAIVTVIIGGGAYTINQSDVVNNFASDTGMTEQQAEDYVASVKEEDLISYNELGKFYIDDGNQVLATLAEIDCVNYKYDWETPTMSCQQGKSQLTELGNHEVALGNAYQKLDTADGSRDDISNTVALIDRVNATYSYEIVGKLLDASTIDYNKKSNSYNKATLQAALQSN